MEVQKQIKRIEAELTNGKVYAYEVPSVRAIDAPSPDFYRVVFDENQIELLYTDKMVRCKLWLQDVPKIVVPNTAQVIDINSAKKKNNSKK